MKILKFYIASLGGKKIIRQFVKFCLVGFLNTFVDFGVYLFFSRIVGLYFLSANILAVFVAMTSSFILNKYWTFQNHGQSIKMQYLKFFLVNIVYFFLNNLIVFSSVHYLLISDILAKVMAITVGLFWNFFANRYWTFNNANKAD
ncbi:MAG: GtrA family protein [Candidatus Parcubacteria bacterium]|nr:GtrA family protein [Candidatus Parcubacteria bacterium]